MGSSDEPVAIETVFGWVLGGPCKEITSKTTACHNVTCVPFEGIEEALKSFYEAETLPSRKSAEEPEENLFRKEVIDNMTYDEVEKQYTVEIPYRPQIKNLQENKNIAEAMYKKQIRRLDSNPELKKDVENAFQK